MATKEMNYRNMYLQSANELNNVYANNQLETPYATTERSWNLLT